jgi:hypothetical protein
MLNVLVRGCVALGKFLYRAFGGNAAKRITTEHVPALAKEVGKVTHQTATKRGVRLAKEGADFKKDRVYNSLMDTHYKANQIAWRTGANPNASSLGKAAEDVGHVALGFVATDMLIDQAAKQIDLGQEEKHPETQCKIKPTLSP